MELRDTIYKYIYPLLGLIVLALVIAIFVSQLKPKSDDNSTNDDSSTSSQNSENESVNDFVPAITVTYIEDKGSINNCFTAVNNKVYFITQEYIESIHPGGAAEIRQMCGKDATTEFNAQHERSGEAKADLSTFFISDLINENELTIDFVALRNESTNCLMAIDNKVYALTEEYINNLHPAGARGISEACGTDATDVYNRIHEGSSKAEADLADFYIGDLVK